MRFIKIYIRFNINHIPRFFEQDQLENISGSPSDKGPRRGYWAERDEPRVDRWYSFDRAWEQTEIEPRLTTPRCPWTNGQVERMNRTIKDATVKRDHHISHDEFRLHLPLFVEAYNCRRRDDLRPVRFRQEGASQMQGAAPHAPDDPSCGRDEFDSRPIGAMM